MDEIHLFLPPVGFFLYVLGKMITKARTKFEQATAQLEDLLELANQINHRLERLENHVFGVHSLVFDKAEQILCFQESFIAEEFDDVLAKVVDKCMKADSVKLKITIWTRSPLVAPYSDWSISVYTERKSNIYYVHRYVLGARSDYFCRVFSGEWPSIETTESRSSILLHIITYDVFPQFLDYLYRGRIKVEIWNAMALCWFADYFGVASLRKEVFQCITPIQDTESCRTYIEHAERLGCIDLIKDEVDSFCYCQPDAADCIRGIEHIILPAGSSTISKGN